jgi:WD40 repeat protein
MLDVSRLIMGLSKLIRTATTPPSLSPSGSYLAAFNGTHLIIYRTASYRIEKTVPLQSQTGVIKWSHRSTSSQPRILFATDDTIRIWSLQDLSWSATLNNGTGGLGKIANAEFGVSDDEVLVLSDFNSKLTVWNTKTGRTIDIRDPKFPIGGHEYRPNSEILAILTKSAAQDMLTIHAPRSYKVITSAALPTSDAQGLKWSPDGMWIAVWDADTAGLKVFIYTADGNFYRTYTDDDDQGLGVQCIEWSPDSQYLAISGYDNRVMLLSAKTVCWEPHTNSV